MRKSLVALFLLVAALASQVPQVLEHYNCQGMSPDGEYQFPLTVKVQGDNYLFSWADDLVIGLGIRQDDYLAVAFVNTLIGKVGVVQYQVRPGQLIGKWAGGGGKVYQELCLGG